MSADFNADSCRWALSNTAIASNGFHDQRDSLNSAFSTENTSHENVGQGSGICAIDSKEGLAQMGRNTNQQSFDALYPSPFIEQASSDPTHCPPDRSSMGILEKLGFLALQREFVKIDNVVVEVTYLPRTGARCVAQITRGPPELVGFKTEPLHRDHPGGWENNAFQQIERHVHNKVSSRDPHFAMDFVVPQKGDQTPAKNASEETTTRSAEKLDVKTKIEAPSEQLSPPPVDENASKTLFNMPDGIQQQQPEDIPYQEDFVLTTPFDIREFDKKAEGKNKSSPDVLKALFNEVLEFVEGLDDTLHEEEPKQNFKEAGNLRKALGQSKRDVVFEKDALAYVCSEWDQAKTLYEKMSRDPQADLNSLRALQQKLSDCQQAFDEIYNRLKQAQKNCKKISREIRQKQQKISEESTKENTTEKNTKESSWISTAMEGIRKTHENAIKECDKRTLQGKVRARKGALKQEKAKALLEMSKEQKLFSRQILEGENTESNINALIQADQAAEKYLQQSKALAREGTRGVVLGKAQQGASQEAKKQIEGLNEAVGGSLGSELMHAMLDSKSSAAEKCKNVVWNTGTSVGSEGVKSIVWEGLKGGVTGCAPAIANRMPGVGTVAKAITIGKSAWDATWNSKSWTEAGSRVMQTGAKMGGQFVAGEVGKYVGGVLGTAIPIPVVGPFIGATVGGMVGTGAYELGAFAVRQLSV